MKHRIYDEAGKKVSVRMCVSCRQRKTKDELCRIVKSPDGVVFVDQKGTSPGRGAYICKNAECVEKSKKSGQIQRGIKANVPKEVYEVLSDIAKQ